MINKRSGWLQFPPILALLQAMVLLRSTKIAQQAAMQVLGIVFDV
jgi:hypothetical protein